MDLALLPEGQFGNFLKDLGPRSGQARRRKKEQATKLCKDTIHGSSLLFFIVRLGMRVKSSEP
jgi:hypothetical protein